MVRYHLHRIPYTLIVKQILELHQFEYGVSSTKNKGTTFYFKINH